ncbi:MAG TPA: YbhB/YbcL family Raf kinase inhibitor-like protein [Rhodocyclaceae bacterium]|nr:YbhB/YbcL family Raf kinase inhibitor-like protein [Rhodocyclaceae bacterium]HRQ46421.1 YbhB/YbcL family Raf kinase inhibitor-like protein [Rhodocyclaceae bacterium]
MKLTSNSFEDGAPIPGEFAFCIPAREGHVCLGRNLNPHLAWRNVPPGTRSFVLICHDPDVPSRGDDVNQEGRNVPASLPRVDFFHWVLVDLPASIGEIAAGSFSSEVTPEGKPGPEAAHGSRQGINDYTAWFAGDDTMRGDYHGYDGPCPPWNDELLHHYVFTLYALDVARCPLDGRFDGTAVRKAIEGHVLGEASLTGTYTLNPALRD